MIGLRLLVCGDRNWDSPAYLFQVLDAFHAAYPVAVLIEGEARGADSMARNWAEARGIPVEKYPALWDKYGRAAGPIRNRQMLREGKPDTVIAFHRDLEQSRGTKDMVTVARSSGVPSHIFVVPFVGHRPPWSPLP